MTVLEVFEDLLRQLVKVVGHPDLSLERTKQALARQRSDRLELDDGLTATGDHDFLP